MEVCINDQWGTVCDDLWDSTDATVVCKQLRYSYTGSKCTFFVSKSNCSLFPKIFSFVLIDGVAYSSAYFGVGSGPIVLDDVQCTSSSNQLLECSSRPILLHNCLHSDDAGVGCEGGVSIAKKFVRTFQLFHTNSLTYISQLLVQPVSCDWLEVILKMRAEWRSV